MNFQAICDVELRFLDICIRFGGATSDLLAFETSNVKDLLDKGLLKPGLCIFGDNAYVNRSYMATPFPGVKGENDKDAYNFFFSQLRIKIECAFGVLVQRWGFLRKIAPFKYRLTKTMATVQCLCRLHNFLINERLSHQATRNEEIENVHDVPTATGIDNMRLSLQGAVPLEERDPVHAPGHLMPAQLLDVSHHRDDDRDGLIRRAIRREGEGQRLPRDEMLEIVVRSGNRRPLRNRIRNVNR